MVDFRNSKRVETSTASIKVDAGLPVGNYIFQLTALDAEGNQSVPARLKVAIVRSSLPTGPITRVPIGTAEPILNESVRLMAADNPAALTVADTTEKTAKARKKTGKRKTTANKALTKAVTRKTNRKKRNQPDST